ncbi:hypothetical protein QJQ45_011422 [Haematococcus lacustris]|nr:hypothetical protein QJQ45_011422 [Haematococcus lacustris]
MEGEASNFDPNVNTQPFRGRKPDPTVAQLQARLLLVCVNWSAWGRLFDDPRRSGLDMASAEKLIFIQTNDELAANYDSVDQSNQQDVAISLF